VRTQAQRGGAVASRGERNREAFLTALNGTMYDDDPAQGTIDGQRFVHRDLRSRSPRRRDSGFRTARAPSPSRARAGRRSSARARSARAG
jgi:predicted Zn-dependent protease